jgi:hypothetical protein
MYIHFLKKKRFIKKRNVTSNEHSLSELYIETVVEQLLDVAQGISALSLLKSKADNYIVDQFLQVTHYY